MYPQYSERLKTFINSEIVNYQTRVIGSDYKKSTKDNSSNINKNANGFTNIEPSELQKQPCLENGLNE
jgi:hypothetical protein